MARIAAAALLAILLLTGASASAQDAASTDIYEYVQSRLDAVYSEVIAEYQQAVTDNPGDVVVALRHCDAMSFFAYSEDVYREDAADDAEECKRLALENYGGHIELLLPMLQQRYDEFALADGRELIVNRDGRYNQSQMARLYLQLESKLNFSDDPSTAGAYCLRALVVDAAADCRLSAADYLHERGDTENAVAILESPLDANNEVYYRTLKIEKLAEFGASAAVARQFEQLDIEELGDHLRVQLSTTLATAGMQDAALTMLEGVSEDFWDKSQLLQAQFDVAMTLGDYAAARDYYYERQDIDFWNDPLLRQRFELAGADATLGWRWVDLLGLGALIALLGVVTLIALAVPAGVHYRGLVRKGKGLAAGLAESSWTLCHAAYAIFAILFLSVLSMYIFEYDLFFASYFGDYWEEPDWVNADLGRMLLLNAVALAVLLSPLVLLKGRWRRLGPGDWSIMKCIGVGVGLAIVMRLLFAIPIAINPELFGLGETMLTPEAIRKIYVTYGFLTVLLVTSVLVPIIEEVSFRGIILQGFSRHITTTGANLLQSAIFAGLHENWMIFPFFLVLAFVAGVVVRRANGLLPAIIMHAVFNAVAVTALAAAIGG